LATAQLPFNDHFEPRPQVVGNRLDKLADNPHLLVDSISA
jgi:hypothetical protein